MVKDIGSREDIERMMRQFYDRLLRIPDMQKVFENVDMEAHMPHIVHFWSFVLLDEEGYKTNVFDKHLSLPIKTPQFDIWLEVFIKNADAHFAGPVTELAKSRATSLAFTFKAKWAKIKGE